MHEAGLMSASAGTFLCILMCTSYTEEKGMERIELSTRKHIINKEKKRCFLDQLSEQKTNQGVITEHVVCEPNLHDISRYVYNWTNTGVNACNIS